MAEDRNEWVERVLGFRFDALPSLEELDDPDLDVAGETAELDGMGLDVTELWEGAIEAFQTATETVDGQITALQAALRETDDVDLHDIADSGLNALTGNTRVPLMAAIREAGRGSREKLQAASPKLLKAISAFRTQLASPVVAACDNNPFGVPVSVEATYAASLDNLATAARMAA